MLLTQGGVFKGLVYENRGTTGMKTGLRSTEIRRKRFAIPGFQQVPPPSLRIHLYSQKTHPTVASLRVQVCGFRLWH